MTWILLYAQEFCYLLIITSQPTTPLASSSSPKGLIFLNLLQIILSVLPFPWCCCHHLFCRLIPVFSPAHCKVIVV